MTIKTPYRVSLITLFLALSTASLIACGGDDDPAVAAVSGGNSVPRITGTANTTTMQGIPYAFTPSATDGDGNLLTFSVTNLPPWATFDSSTGRLTGTPTAAQLGAYSNITISVSDGRATVSLAPFRITVTATATGSATLSWNPPTQNTDGTPLANLAGYRVYWGTSQGSYPNSVTVNNPGLASYVVDQLTPARWFFVITAVTSNGVESGFSNVASKTVQ